VQDEAGRRHWAAKCFTRHVDGLQDRYHRIDAHLQQHRLPFMVDFRYLPDIVLVRGQWYAFLKMDWVEGLRLDEAGGSWSLIGPWYARSSRIIRGKHFDAVY